MRIAVIGHYANNNERGIDRSVGEWGDLITFRLDLAEILGVSKQEKKRATMYPKSVTDVWHIHATKNSQSIAILMPKAVLN